MKTSKTDNSNAPVHIRLDSGAIGRIWEKRLGCYGWAHPNGSEGEAQSFRKAEDELNAVEAHENL